MECPARMSGEPLSHLGMLVRRIIVGDGVDQLARRDIGLDGVEEANELLVPVTLHAAPDYLSIQHVECGK